MNRVIRIMMVSTLLFVSVPTWAQEKTPFEVALAKVERCRNLGKCPAMKELTELVGQDAALLEKLAGGTVKAQQAAMRIMAAEGMNSKALFRLMESKDEAVLVETLGLIANTRQNELAPSVLETARKARKAGNEQLLLKAVFALGRLEYVDARPLLMELIHDDVQKVGRAAIEALGRVGGNEEVVASVVKKANDKGQPLNRRLAAIRGLGFFSESAALDALVELSRDDEVAIRKAAIQALGVRKDRRAVPQLFERMKDDEVLPELVDALGRIGGEKAAGMLYNLAVDEKRPAGLRDEALFAAGKAGSQRAMPDLLKALESSKSDRRARAAEAIGYLADPGAVKPLYERFKKAGGREKTMVLWAIKRCSKESLETAEQIEEYLERKGK